MSGSVNRLQGLRWVTPLVLLILFGAAAIPSLLWRPLEYDELLQYYVAAQPSIAQVLSSLASNPPTTDPALSYILSHFTMKLLGPSEMAFRLPSFCGYLAGVITFYFFLERRFGPICAALGQTVLYIGQEFKTQTSNFGIIYYAAYGRSYGLVVGACGVSLLAWQNYRESLSRRWLVLLIVALAAGINSHYFALLLGVPILLAELDISIRTKRPDWNAIGALLAPYATCLLWIPFWNAAHTFRPVVGNRIGAFANAFGVYGDLLAPWLLVFVLVIALFGTLLRPPTLRNPEREAVNDGLTSAEWLAMASLVAFPFIAYVLAKFGSGLFIPRYVLAMGFGCSAFIAGLVFRTTGRNSILAGLAFSAIGLVIIAKGLVETRSLRIERADTKTTADRLLQGPAPILIDDPYVFLTTFRYAGSDLREKLRYPLDPAVLLPRIGSGTMWLSLRGLSHLSVFSGVFPPLRYFQDHVQRFQFVETVDHSHAWVLAEFLSAGWTARLDRTDGANRIFSMERPAAQAQR